MCCILFITFTLVNNDIRYICPTDVIAGSWKKKDKAETSPNIVKLIDWFNKYISLQHAYLEIIMFGFRVTGWVQTEVVSTVSLKDRTQVVAKFIQVCLFFPV